MSLRGLEGHGFLEQSERENHDRHRVELREFHHRGQIRRRCDELRENHVRCLLEIHHRHHYHYDRFRYGHFHYDHLHDDRVHCHRGL